jgi:hypothetical protein
MFIDYPNDEQHGGLRLVLLWQDCSAFSLRDI